MRCTWRAILLTGLALIGSQRTWAADPAQPSPDSAGPPPIKLAVTAAAAPAAALQYRLLPPAWELQRGNAALVYTKLAISMHVTEFALVQERFDQWLEMPAAELPLDEIRAALVWQSWFDDLDLAAHLNDCDWQLPLGDRPLLTLTLPEVQSCREMARLLAVRARLQVADGKLNDALRTFQDGFALGQNVAKGPTLIHGLVGIAISQTMFKALRDFVEHRQSPNLYWALTALPSPLVDMRKAADVESAMLYLCYPDLRAIHAGDRTPRDWQAVIDRVLGDLEAIRPGPALNRLVLTALALKAYPEAKQRLIDQGHSAREVDGMAVFEVIAIDALATYDELRDQTMCWFYFPYWQARPHLEAAEQYLATTGRQRETIPLASQLVPAMRSVARSQARIDREVAILRVIEAVRMYAADHDRQLPAKLTDITAVPLPIDPLTGKAFGYRAVGEEAVVSSIPGDEPASHQLGVRYAVQIVK